MNNDGPFLLLVAVINNSYFISSNSITSQCLHPNPVHYFKSKINPGKVDSLCSVYKLYQHFAYILNFRVWGYVCLCYIRVGRVGDTHQFFDVVTAQVQDFQLDQEGHGLGQELNHVLPEFQGHQTRQAGRQKK